MLENFEGFLDAYEAHGLNTVALTWFNPVNPLTGQILQSYGPDVPDYFLTLPTDDALTEFTEMAHERGFKVIWKPHFITDNARAGNINPFFADAGFDEIAFLNNVNTYWEGLAPLAEQAGVELLIVGTEHEAYAGPAYDAQWREIIQTVRDRFSGEVTYDALSYIGTGSVAVDDITFWDALDYIGISMYLPLDDGIGEPSLNEAYATLFDNYIASWHGGPNANAPQVFEDLATLWGKDVIFTEVGSQSRVGALENPPFTTGALDYWEQAVLYAVHYDVFSQFDWFQGFSWWANDHEDKSPPGTAGWEDFWFYSHNTEYSYLEKPAGDIVRGFWAHGWDGAPLEGDLLLGFAGADTIQGGALGDLIVSMQGSDVIHGESGDDRLFGGDGRDTLYGDQGDDVIYGGTSFNDEADEVFGGSGNDTVFGLSGADTLRGGRGNDQIDGGDENDVIRGQRDGDFVSGGNGADNIKGGGGNDTLHGGAGDDFLKGGTRRDDIFGGSGNDRLLGNSFDDILDGGAGNDRLIAGGENDTLDGGTGNDFLRGGSGADTFVFNPGDGNDVFDDFNFAEDLLQLGDFGLSAQEVEELAAVSDGDLVIAFSATESITMSGVTTNEGLAEVISFV